MANKIHSNKTMTVAKCLFKARLPKCRSPKTSALLFVPPGSNTVKTEFSYSVIILHVNGSNVVLSLTRRALSFSFDTLQIREVLKTLYLVHLTSFNSMHYTSEHFGIQVLKFASAWDKTLINYQAFLGSRW